MGDETILAIALVLMFVSGMALTAYVATTVERARWNQRMREIGLRPKSEITKPRYANPEDDPLFKAHHPSGHGYYVWEDK